MNVAAHLWRMAARAPHSPALAVQVSGDRLTFAALAARAAGIAQRLRGLGIERGDRVLLMVRPGSDFVALAFALLALGAVPVFVDPGIGRRHIVDCIAQARPKGIIAERLLYALAALQPRLLAGVQVKVSVQWWPGTRSVASLRRHPIGDFDPVLLAPDADAVLAFTSGATGIPKGVLLPHSVLAAQLESFKRLGRVGERDVYLAILPVLAILGPGLGCCTVLPDIDARRPRAINPATVLHAIGRYGVTHAFGSPAVWSKVAEAGVQLPSMRCLMIGGAPVAPTLLARLASLLPNGDVQTPYGATEAMPLASASAREVLEERGSERGTLVGRPLPGVELRVVSISDGPLPHARPLAAGEVGEIVVRGAVVSRGYQGRQDADALARIPDAAGAWHRMGDLGMLDEAGRLWFCGRKSERVRGAGQTLYTACVEPRFESHPLVQRAALVGAAGEAVLVVEPKAGARADAAAAEEILALRGTLPVVRVLFKRCLPLDGRHAAKILRGELARWAERQLA